MENIRRYLYFGVFLLIVCSVFSAGNPARAKAAEAITLWAWDESFNVKAAKLAAKEYEREHPEISVQVVTMEQEDIMDKLDNFLASGMYEELPNIILMEDYRSKAYLKKYPEEFLDLTEEMDFGSFIDYKVKAVTQEGRQYGIPFDCGAGVLFYRIDYLTQAGYGEEDMQELTWGEFIQIGKEIRDRVNVPLLAVEPDDLGLIRLMMQSAGSWYVKPGGNEAFIADNEVLKAAESIYEECIREGLTVSVSGWNQFVNAFQEGEVAAVPYGCWLASSIKEEETQAGKWRVAEFPRMETVPESKNASSIGGSSWYILAKKPGSREALEFMKAMFGDNPEFINTLIKEIDLVTAYKQAEELSNYQEEDDFFGGRNVMELYRRTALETPEVDFGWNTYAIEDIFSEELLKIFMGEDRDTAFRRAQKKAQAVIDS